MLKTFVLLVNFKALTYPIQTGIHGRIFSSDSGTPLPATITLKGIDYLVCSNL